MYTKRKKLAKQYKNLKQYLKEILEIITNICFNIA